MKCPKCNGELQVMCKKEVNDNTLEVIGICEDCFYDGTWFIEKDEEGNVVKEYDLKKLLKNPRSEVARKVMIMVTVFIAQRI